MPSFIKILLFILFTCVQNVNAQKIFHISIQIPNSLVRKKLSCSYDNGIKTISITDSFINNKLNISGKFYSKFAVLTMVYFENDSVSYMDNYFIDTQPADLIFLPDYRILKEDPFANGKIVNAICVNQTEIYKKLYEFNAVEITAINNFWKKNHGYIGREDSITKLYYKTLLEVNNKNIEFIKKNGSDYFSFWYFRNQIVPNVFGYNKSGISDFENLLSVFNTSFPDSFKKSYEGTEIEKLLIGKIKTQLNTKAPDFNTMGMNGEIVQLSKFKGKYVLLDFWATWCNPCMEEIPFIKQIRNNYGNDKLEIVGINNDREGSMVKVQNVIQENKMNWTNIFGNEDISKLFGVGAIPVVILINKDGIIVYRSVGEEHEELIELLKKM